MISSQFGYFMKSNNLLGVLMQTKNYLVLKFCQLTSIYIILSQQKQTIKTYILNF